MTIRARLLLWPLVAFAALGILWLLRKPEKPGASVRAGTSFREDAPVTAATPEGRGTRTASGGTEPERTRASGERRGRVRVTDVSGRPLARSRIKAAISTDYFQTHEVVELETDGDGNCGSEWPEGAWIVLNVWSDGMAPQAVTLTAPGPLAVRLAPGTGLAGTAASASGAPLVHARLRLEPILPETNMTNRVLSRLSLVDAEVTTDSRGGFDCHTLRNVDYRVVFVDRPGTPGMILRAADVKAGRVALRTPW
ncbi:MAG: hypothetical protein HYY17_00850 [Planctomycetes bacterium]|nr:hypothetical protein [Planctomycetota bacterium]